MSANPQPHHAIDFQTGKIMAEPGPGVAAIKETRYTNVFSQLVMKLVYEPCCKVWF